MTSDPVDDPSGGGDGGANDRDGDATDEPAHEPDKSEQGPGVPAVPDDVYHVPGNLLRYEVVPDELAEALRSVINRNELRTGDPLPRTIAVTSAVAGEGVTTMSQALATVIAHEMGRFVCWVDCSWLAPQLQNVTIDQRRNLIDILADPSRIGSAFQSSPQLPQLIVLAAGSVPDDKRHMIVRSPEFGRLLGILTEEFDHVIFDTPPVLSNANSLALLRRADSSLMVVEHRATSIAQVQRAIDTTQPTPTLGVLLNRFNTSVPARLRRLLGD